MRLFRLTILLFALFLQSALAHEARPTIANLDLSNDRSFALVIDSNLEALLVGIGPEHEDTDDAPEAERYNELRALAPEALEPQARAFLTERLATPPLVFLDEAGEPVAVDLAIDAIEIPAIGDLDVARDTVLRLSGQIPDGAAQLRWTWPEGWGASVIRIERPGQELEAQFTQAGATAGPFDIGLAAPGSWLEKAWTYGVIGFTHILPKGLDHILFVLGLFFFSVRWGPLLAQVTAFTVAHSVTLALGLYGIVSISPSIVEPLIALSIVYVGVENIFIRTLHWWRPVIVFAFGLLHGLGFAGILTEIGLPRSDFVLGLVAFNVGVEAGQLAVIALAFLLVGWFVSKPCYRTAIAIPASLLIALVGAYWVVERTLL